MADGERSFWSDFWDAPYRPLFLAAYMWALVSILIWPVGPWLGLPEPGLGLPSLWHAHEMLFGFAALAKGGYMLSALPGWTGCAPIIGTRLKLLFVFWASSRVVILFSDSLPLAPLLVVNACYFLFLSWIMLSRILAARKYDRVPFGMAVVVMGLLQAGCVANAKMGAPWVSLDLIRAGVVVLSVLMVAIGARAIPAFTANWMKTVGIEPMPPLLSRAGKVAVCLLIAALVSIAVGLPALGYRLMLFAAVSMLVMMVKWRSSVALKNPLLAALHVSYLFLVLGLGAVAVLGIEDFPYPLADVLHAVTIGAAAGLIMAISGRAGAHQEDGTMRASFGFSAGVLMVWLSSVIRLIAPLVVAYDMVILISSLVWILGWVVFVYGFRSALHGPPRRPAFSGKSRL